MNPPLFCGVRRLAAAFLQATRDRRESGSKLPHSKMIYLEKVDKAQLLPEEKKLCAQAKAGT
jgi:hypothetical protein